MAANLARNRAAAGGGNSDRGDQEARRREEARRLGREPRRDEEYAKNYAIVVVTGIARPLPNVPANYDKMLLKNDFVWAAKNRDKILEEWNKRYNDKAEKS